MKSNCGDDRGGMDRIHPSLRFLTVQADSNKAYEGYALSEGACGKLTPSYWVEKALALSAVEGVVQ
jgi:hypothetical protein